MQTKTNLTQENTDSQNSLTCIACRLFFPDLEAQREHFKTDLHRFNLKRKVAALPPITQEWFDKKMSALKSASEDVKRDVPSFTCQPCSKQFNGEKTYKNHMKSKKHKENVVNPLPQKNIKKKEPKQINTPEKPLSEMTDDEWIAHKIANSVKLTEKDCLFCSHSSISMEENLNHMSTEHSFFVPDIEYLKDLKGLLIYLGEKVSIGNVCLFCNGKGKQFQSLASVQAHMRDLSHCKLAYSDDDEAEYEEYYDFSSSYGIDIPEGTELTEDQLLELVDSKVKVQVSSDGSEIQFNDGRSIGHRSLRIYYKQNPKPEDLRQSVVISKLMAKYKSLGWTNDRTGNNEIEKKVQRRMDRNKMNLGVKANKLFKPRLQCPI